MSKPRYRWWGYIKAVIRNYPALKKEHENLHEQSVTAKFSGMPGNGSVSRGTEDIAIRELPFTNQREYEAVKRAIQRTQQYKNGTERLTIIDLVYWKKCHTIDGAAYRVGYSYDRAKQIHKEFVILVATYYGLMDYQIRENKLPTKAKKV